MGFTKTFWRAHFAISLFLKFENEMKIVNFFLGMEGASQNGDGGGGGLRWIKSQTVSILCVSPPANQRHLQTGSQVVSAPEVEKVDLLDLTDVTDGRRRDEGTRGTSRCVATRWCRMQHNGILSFQSPRAEFSPPTPFLQSPHFFSFPHLSSLLCFLTSSAH